MQIWFDTLFYFILFFGCIILEYDSSGASNKSESLELLFKPKFEVALAIQDLFAGNDPSQYSVFIQSPFEADVRATPEYADDKDVWIYTTVGIDGIVYEIPRHGQWHPNRMLSFLISIVQVANLGILKWFQFLFVNTWSWMCKMWGNMSHNSCSYAAIFKITFNY